MSFRVAASAFRPFAVASRAPKRYLARRHKSNSAPPLTHLDDQGEARMVDISSKPSTKRTAKASAVVHLGPSVYARLASSIQGTSNAWKKGDVLTVAQIAGIQAAKNASQLIPLCHPIPLSHVLVNVRLQPPANVHINTTVSTTGPTGVEMEALSAACVAALTVYDMCKAAGKGIAIREVRLEEKSGGRSGFFHAYPKSVPSTPPSSSGEDASTS